MTCICHRVYCSYIQLLLYCCCRRCCCGRRCLLLLLSLVLRSFATNKPSKTHLLFSKKQQMTVCLVLPLAVPQKNCSSATQQASPDFSERAAKDTKTRTTTVDSNDNKNNNHSNNNSNNDDSDNDTDMTTTATALTTMTAMTATMAVAGVTFLRWPHNTADTLTRFLRRTCALLLLLCCCCEH